MEFIPVFPNDDLDEEEERAPNSLRKQISASSDSSVKLLAMLPAPKSQKKGKLFLPASINRPKPKATPLGSKGKSSLPKKPNTNSLVPNYEQQEENVTSDSEDFLRLAASKDTVEIGLIEEELGNVYGPPKPPPDLPQPESPGPSSRHVHPSQAYNYVDENPSFGPEIAGTSQSSEMSDRRAADLIYKNELQHWGVQPEEVEIPEFVDVNVDCKLGLNIQENLLKNLSGRPVPPPSVGKQKEKDKDKPGQTAKRKHQITYLAFMAKEREEQLKDQWANNKFSRAQTPAKYGF